MKFLLLAIVLISILPPLARAQTNAADESQKAILITGASTGIGRATAEHLAAKGYFVYAGARKDADIDALNKLQNILAVRLDVTKQDEVDAVVRLIQDEGRGLWGLVNNAGVGVFAPTAVAKQADLEHIFAVNVFGVFRVTQAFLPMIIESKGRIVNISSISGVISNQTTGMYSGSKHAVEAMTDALAKEMRDLGVHVAAVNPGSFASAFLKKECARKQQDAETDWGHLEETRQWWIDRCRKREDSGYESTAANPVAVAYTIEQALFEEHPRSRYLVASQAGAGETIAWSIRELLTLNIGHEQSYSRDEIVRFIDLVWPYVSGEKNWRSLEEEWEFEDQWIERREPDLD